MLIGYVVADLTPATHFTANKETHNEQWIEAKYDWISYIIMYICLKLPLYYNNFDSLGLSGHDNRRVTRDRDDIGSGGHVVRN